MIPYRLQCPLLRLIAGRLVKDQFFDSYSMYWLKFQYTKADPLSKSSKSPKYLQKHDKILMLGTYSGQRLSGMFLGYSPSKRAAITAQSHNLLKFFWPLSNLVPISLARWVESLNTKFGKMRKLWSRLWICVVMAVLCFGSVQLFYFHALKFFSVCTF